MVLSYEIARRLPEKERFGPISQIQRAAASIPANIAEGHGRWHLGDKLHHFSVANGSAKELETHFLIAERLLYVQRVEIIPALDLSAEVGKMLSALAQKLSARRR